MERCILVIFIDSLMGYDYDMLNELDNFKYVISKGSVVRKVKSQYPNLKNSVSATILTGELPDRHGIYLNNFDISVRNYHSKEYEDIYSPTILDLFKENNNKVSTIFWPNMGYSNFKYNFSDINSVKLKDIVGGIVKGSSFYMLKNIFKYSNILKINMQPECDNFSSILAMELLEKRKSNVIFLSFNHLGYVRRRYGLDFTNTFKALESIDKKIGDLLSWCDNKNILDNLVLSIVSGGGCYENKYIININYMLLKSGFITLNKRGKIVKYLAYAHCEGGSAFIYLNDLNNVNDYGKVKVFLEEISKKYSKYIKFVGDTNEYEKFNLNNFSFRLEAKPNCIFSGEFNKHEFVENSSLSLHANSEISKAFYGYSDNFNSQGIFINYGKRIRQGMEIYECNLTDIAPTIASFMDLKFDCSGKIIKNILEEH